MRKRFQVLAAISRSLAALALGSCGGDKSAAPAPAGAQAKPAHHEHHPPHEGALAELGEEFAHLEFTLDPAEGKLTAYALDGEAENSVRLKQPTIRVALKLAKPGGARSLDLDLAAVANALTGETVGDTSEFAAASAELKGAASFEGTIREVEIRGSRFRDAHFAFPAAKP